MGFRKDRLSALQDGIFAVALTLLALDLRIPEGLSRAGIHQRFVELLPAIGIYATTFAIIAVVWLYVYSFQEIVPGHDMVSSSLLLLACSFVVLLPFTSSGFAKYPSEPFCVLSFSSNVLSMLVTYTIYVEYAARRLIPPPVDRGLIRIVVYLLRIEVAFGAVTVAFFSWPLLTILWLVFGTTAAYVSLWILHGRFARAALVASDLTRPPFGP